MCIRDRHTGSVGDGLLLADLAAGRVKVGHCHAQIVGSDLEAATGAGGGLFKDQGNVFAPQLVVTDTGFLLAFRSAASSSSCPISAGV